MFGIQHTWNRFNYRKGFSIFSSKMPQGLLLNHKSKIFTQWNKVVFSSRQSVALPFYSIVSKICIPFQKKFFWYFSPPFSQTTFLKIFKIFFPIWWIIPICALMNVLHKHFNKILVSSHKAVSTCNFFFPQLFYFCLILQKG